MSNLGGKKMSEDTDRDNQTAGVVETIVAGDRISVNSSDPANPIVTADVQAGGQVDSVVGGTNCSVDATDPVNPIVNADTQNNAKVTTKGDLEGFSTVAARIPVGTNDQVLTADSSEALGLKWATPAASSGDVATDTIWDVKGDLAGGTGADTAARLAVGTNDQVLTADSAETTGMKWTTPAAGGGATPVTVELSGKIIGAASGSSSATKGVKLTMLSTVSLHHLTIVTGVQASGTYELVIAEISGASNTVDVILSRTTDGGAATAGFAQRVFKFATPIVLTSAKEIAIVLTRTDGSGTAINAVTFPAQDIDAVMPYFDIDGILIVADNDIQVSDNLGAATASFSTYASLSLTV